jgi:hypothetical protein
VSKRLGAVPRLAAVPSRPGRQAQGRGGLGRQAKRPPDVTEGKYTIELCRPGGIRDGVEGAIVSDDDLTAARALYRQAVASNPGHVVPLCGRARVLARSDRLDTMP